MKHNKISYISNGSFSIPGTPPAVFYAQAPVIYVSSSNVASDLLADQASTNQ